MKVEESRHTGNFFLLVKNSTHHKTLKCRKLEEKMIIVPLFLYLSLLFCQFLLYMNFEKLGIFFVVAVFFYFYFLPAQIL